LCPVVSGSVFVFLWGGIYSKASTWESKNLAVAFNLTFRYIDDVLSINNNHFHSYVDSIYPNELEIEDTSECSTSASCLDVVLKLDTNGKLSTQLYDKRDDFNFSIVNFPYLCSNIPASSAYGVYISQLIRYARACSAYVISFYFEAIYWQRSWCHKGFKCLAYRQLSANFMVVTTTLFTHTTFLWATCCVICFITIVKPFLTLILTTVHTVYLIWKKGSRRLWSIDRGCSMAPDPTFDIFRGPCTPILWFVFPIGPMRLNTVRCFCHFIFQIWIFL
jgi:hypothetical protein